MFHIIEYKEKLEYKRLLANIPKILIIDDDYLIRKSLRIIISEFLKKSGLIYQILEGSDGSEMIDLVMKDTDNSVKLIFIDENMPSIEGSKAISKILEIKRNNGVKIISVTSLQDSNSIEKIINSGADVVVNKPAHRKVIENMLLEFLKKRN